MRSVELAFRCVGLEYEQYVVTDHDLFRPAEVNILQEDAAKARRELGWMPKMNFEELVREMIFSDCGIR